MLLCRHKCKIRPLPWNSVSSLNLAQYRPSSLRLSSSAEWIWRWIALYRWSEEYPSVRSKRIRHRGFCYRILCTGRCSNSRLCRLKGGPMIFRSSQIRLKILSSCKEKCGSDCAYQQPITETMWSIIENMNLNSFLKRVHSCCALSMCSNQSVPIFGKKIKYLPSF